MIHLLQFFHVLFFSGSLYVPVPNFPVVGNSLPVGVFFIAHVTIAEYSIGAIILAVALETWAVVKHDPRGMRYARALTNSYYLLFSLGATFAVFAVMLMIGLWGPLMGTLINEFLPVVAVAFGLFIVLMPALVVYRNSFGKMGPRAHLALGMLVAALQTLFLVLIVAIDSYLITPTATSYGALASPSYLPLLLHRLVGSISWTALLLAAVAVIRLRQAGSEEERLFQSWAARLNLRIGVVFLMLMPVIGYILLLTLQGSVVGYFDNLVGGSAGNAMVLQMCIFSIVLISANVAIGWEKEPGTSSGVMLLLVIVGCTVGTLPSSVLGPSIFLLRYIGTAFAVVITMLNLIWHSLAGTEVEAAAAHPAPGAQRLIAFEGSAAARWAVVIAGVLAAVLALYMGYLKEEARGTYAVYGVLQQSAAHGHYQPPAGIYPTS